MFKHFCVLLLLVGFCSSANAAVLCSNASGSVFVRDDICRGGETQLDPVALGLRGPGGADGVSGYEVVTEFDEAGPGQAAVAYAICPAGKLPVGGGVGGTDGAGIGGAQILASYPTRDKSERFGWQVVVQNLHATGDIRVTAYAVCVTVRVETA